MASSSRDRHGERSARMAFEVFINHRGSDVKLGLASIIYHWLESTGVTAFLDKKSLQLGDDFPKHLEDVMRSVSVHIAIFSENYAQSDWCLNELLTMLETGVTIIPVFYGVKPCDLRHVDKGKGRYHESFCEHERKGRVEQKTLKKWKKSLEKVSRYYGCEFEFKADCDQGKLLDRIVKLVHEEIKKKKLLNVAKYPVGLDLTVKSFEKMLDSSKNKQSVKFVGIVGQGGSGKTTLAKELYNQKCSLMKRSSFLYDVRYASKNHRLCKLQETLLGDITRRKTFEFDHVSQGLPILAEHLGSVSALIVLDDVDDMNQLDNLLPGKESFPDDSLIIVTSRDLDILKRWGIESIFKMESLKEEQAMRLFSCHAFSQPEPVPEFEDLVTRFVKACHGLPLSLKVFGEMLRGVVNKENWESNLKSVEEAMPGEIVEVLRVSYDSLGVKQQQMFLDTACFFIGEKKSLAIEVWYGSGWIGRAGLETLVNKCLVELDHHGRITMHEHLRDLGTKIASETSPYRIWVAQQIKKIRSHSKETTEIRGIMAAKTLFGSYPHQGLPICSHCYPPPFQECMELLRMSNRGFERLKSSLLLQLLVVAQDQIGSKFSEFSELSLDLVWLRWFDYNDKCLPQWLSLKKLRVLEFCGTVNLEGLWTDDPCNLPACQLTEFTVAANSGYSFNIFPSSISHFKSLKKMVLISRSGREFGFTSLPEEFCKLEKLEHLELRYCEELLSLPAGFGDLKKLEHLDLYGCKRLKELPVSFKQLTNLIYLDLSGCEVLSITPHILESKQKLEKLYFSGCQNLRELPLHIIDQESLTELHFVDTQLSEIPSRLCQLSKLETLKIGSPRLTAIPASLYCFLSLTHLSIRNCSSLSSIPNCINSETRSPKSHPQLQGLAKLQHLCIKSSNVKSLQILSFSQLTNLQTLKISACPIEELCLKWGFLSNLKVITLKKTGVKSISICDNCCPELETLKLRKNDDLEVIKVLPPSVKVIELAECRNLRKIIGLRDRINLKVSECPKLL